MGCGNEVVEVLEGPELRVDGLVAAAVRADGPGAARVVWAGIQSVVGAFAEAPADRVNGGQVEDIEVHRRDVRKPRLDVLERPVPAGLGRAGAGEQLIPGAVTGPHPLDDDAQSAVVNLAPLPTRVPGPPRPPLG